MAKNRIGFSSDFVLLNNKIGIGTANPNATLDVNGDIEFKEITGVAVGAAASERISLIPYTEEGGALSFENADYDNQHFSVTNEVNNILFAVNDENAEPYLQVNNTGITSVRDGEFLSLAGVAVGAAASERINLIPYTEEAGALSFENAGYDTQHFSVTNEVSNILFAVNDDDANPIFETTTTGITTVTDFTFRKAAGVAVGAAASERINLIPYTEEAGALSFENVSGEYQHLSLTNEIYGDVFAVNDDNANPVLQVSNSGVIHSGITTIGLTTLTTSPLGITTTTPVMSFELQDDTTLRFRVRGTDGTVRTGIVTLA